MHNQKESINFRSTNFMSEAQTATYLMRSKGTLRNWRGRGTHKDILPAYQTSEGAFYNTDDVLSFRKRKKKLGSHKYPRISVFFNNAPIPDLDPTTRLTTVEAALAFGISKASLQIWRSKWQFLNVLPAHGRSLDTHYLAGELAAFILKGRAYWRAQSIERNHEYRPRSKRAA